MARADRAVALFAAGLLVSSCAGPDTIAPGGVPEAPGAQKPAHVREKRPRERKIKRREGDRRRKEHRPKDRSGTRPGDVALVLRAVDGDTIEVSIRGRSIDVRLIGIDTPESVHPLQPVECFGKAASAFTAARLEGERVRLTYDVERRDRYERTLGYVFLNGKLFNETLVAQGHAQVYTYPPNVRYADRFVAAQRAARRHDRGLWGGCRRTQGGAKARPGSGAPGRSGAKGCDPGYEGACIPTAPPDLDCGDVGARNFASVGADPHSFDGDGDGVACE
ncbi:MAG: thermonuclease family protein [Actinomycetota bacterium]